LSPWRRTAVTISATRRSTPFSRVPRRARILAISGLNPASVVLTNLIVITFDQFWILDSGTLNV
jgi:hypothetical protein